MSQTKTELVANGEMSEDVDVDKLHGANLDTFHALNDDTKPKPEPASGPKAEADTDEDVKPNSVQVACGVRPAPPEHPSSTPKANHPNSSPVETPTPTCNATPKLLAPYQAHLSTAETPTPSCDAEQPVLRARNSALRGYKADADVRREHDREYKAFFRAVKGSSAEAVSGEWGAAAKSTLKKSFMMARWKAAGCDLVKMVIRDVLIRSRTEESKKIWVWMTRDETLKRFNGNVAFVDDIEHIKRRNGQARENPDIQGVKAAVQFKILAEQSETESDIKQWQQEMAWEAELTGEDAGQFSKDASKFMESEGSVQHPLPLENRHTAEKRPQNQKARLSRNHKRKGKGKGSRHTRQKQRIKRGGAQET